LLSAKEGREESFHLEVQKVPGGMQFLAVSGDGDSHQADFLQVT
jgi:hypothetical protein